MLIAYNASAQKIVSRETSKAANPSVWPHREHCFQTKTPTAPEDQNLYWPLKQGNLWRYVESTGTDEKQLKGNEESIMTVSKVASSTGRGSLVSIAITLKGHVAGTEQYLLDAGQIYEVAISVGLEKLAPNRRFLKPDLKPGMQWDWKGTSEALGDKTGETCHFVVVGPEQVKTPAGTFQTLHLKQTIAGDDNAGTRHYWFAKGVGIVQRRRTLGTVIAVSKLAAYKLTP
jgi:hypothetical protein